MQLGAKEMTKQKLNKLWDNILLVILSIGILFGYYIMFGGKI